MIAPYLRRPSKHPNAHSSQSRSALRKSASRFRWRVFMLPVPSKPRSPQRAHDHDASFSRGSSVPDDWCVLLCVNYCEQGSEEMSDGDGRTVPITVEVRFESNSVPVWSACTTMGKLGIPKLQRECSSRRLLSNRCSLAPLRFDPRPRERRAALSSPPPSAKLKRTPAQPPFKIVCALCSVGT